MGPPIGSREDAIQMGNPEVRPLGFKGNSEGLGQGKPACGPNLSEIQYTD